jgi:hypothetical protein
MKHFLGVISAAAGFLCNVLIWNLGHGHSSIFPISLIVGLLFLVLLNAHKPYRGDPTGIKYVAGAFIGMYLVVGVARFIYLALQVSSPDVPHDLR